MEEDIINKIKECINRYEDMTLEDTLDQSDILRTLTCNLFYLEEYRSKAHSDWLEVYYTCKQTTNAAKEKWADSQVQELYLYRRIMTAGYRIVDALRSTISIHRKEG